MMKHLESALDGAAKRHTVLSNNIANIDTPNFKRSDVSFQEELRRSIEGSSGASLKLSTTSDKHIAGPGGSQSKFLIVQDNNMIFRNDGNNVDIEKETVEMAKNNLLYNSFVQLLSSRISGLKRAIEEGGR